MWNTGDARRGICIPDPIKLANAHTGGQAEKSETRCWFDGDDGAVVH